MAWKKGKRRNRSQAAVIKRLALLLETWPSRGEVSQRAAAKAAGVSPPTIARWLDGIDNPSAASSEAPSCWMRRFE